MNDAKLGTCALCLETKIIRQSHIVPKFFGNWLRSTSATGYFVSATNASKRKQDIVKVPLLCDCCEERFSKYEGWFSRKIFEPFAKPQSFNEPQSFEYDGNFELFATSLSWRALKFIYDEVKSDRPDLVTLIDKAEYCWREFLLGKRQTNPYESHLLFVDDKEHDVNSLGGSDWYRLRSVDVTLCTSANRVLSYVKLPRMLTVTAIYPSALEGWSGTLVRTSGKITTSQSIDDEGFKEFFANRAQQALTLSPRLSVEMSTKRMKKALEDPSRFLKSETSKIMRKEKDEDLRKKMEKMPENVIGLVDVIIGAVDNPDMSDEYNQSAHWIGRHIANKLSNLPNDELKELDQMIEAVLKESGATRQYARSVWKADSVWVVVMVHNKATKEYQRSKIRDDFENLKSQQGNTKTPIGIFSINCEDGGCSFESGFYV